MIQQQIADAALIPQERLREIMGMPRSSSCAQPTMFRQEVQSDLADGAVQELLDEDAIQCSLLACIQKV